MTRDRETMTPEEVKAMWREHAEKKAKEARELETRATAPGLPEQTWTERAVVECPWCLEEFPDFDASALDDGEDALVTCDGCGKESLIECEVTRTHTARPLAPKEVP